MSDPAYAYSLFGLGIGSDIPLPGVPETAADGHEIWISQGALPAGLPTGPGYVATEPGHGALRAARRSLPDPGWAEIIVERHDAASDRNVRLFLLGSAFGALFHQRGLLPLHANAIDDRRPGDRLFRSFRRRQVDYRRVVPRPRLQGTGRRRLCCHVRRRRSAAYPGLPRLRLWREALEASGRIADGL